MTYIQVCTDDEGFRTWKENLPFSAWPKSEHNSSWGTAHILSVPKDWVHLEEDDFGCFYQIIPIAGESREVI